MITLAKCLDASKSVPPLIKDRWYIVNTAGIFGSTFIPPEWNVLMGKGRWISYLARRFKLVTEDILNRRIL